MFRILILLTLLGSAISVQGQYCSLIKGTITETESGEPLPGATVRLLHNSSIGTSADAKGNFELKVSVVDSLVISFIGFQDKIVPMPVDCDLIVSLSPSQTSLNEVVIKSERLIAEEFTIKKIRKLEIYTNPSAKADPLLAVNSTPSATTTDESANISLRGSSPAETGIFLNNVPINDAVRYGQLNGIGTFSIFNTALISQVQVYPGNPPLEFGNTTSGLISLSTDEVIPEKSTNTVSLSLASVGFYTQQKLGKSSSLTAFSNYQPSSAIKFFNPTALDRIKKFETVDFGIHYFKKINNNAILKIFNYTNKEQFQFETRQPTYTGNLVQEKIRNFTVANFRYRFKKSELSLNNGLSFSNAKFALSTIKTDVHLSDFFSSINFQHFGAVAEFKLGASYDAKNSELNGKFPRYSFALGDQYPVDSVRSQQGLKVPEVYGYVKYFLSAKWIVGAGLRKNIAMDNQTDFLSSQVNLNFKPTSAWNLNLSAGRYNKFQLPQGESNAPYQIQSDQYSFDAGYTKGKLESSLSLFYKSSLQINRQFEIKGLELYGRYRFNSNFRAELSLTSLNAKQTYQGKTTSSPFDIRYFLRGNLEYKIGGTWTLTTVFLFREGSFYVPVVNSFFNSAVGAYQPLYGEQSRLPDYQLVDFSVSKLFQLGKNSTAVAFCGLSNVPNFTNVRSYYYNEDYSQRSEDLFSLRTIYFGIIVNF